MCGDLSPQPQRTTGGILVSWRIASVCLAPLVMLLWTLDARAQRSRDYTPSQFVSVLNGLGYPVKLTDTLDAPNVQQAIRDFQLQYQLPVSGTMTPASQDKAADVVRVLQQSLNRSLQPVTTLPGNQYYGSQTESFIKVFQKRHRLPVTGIATRETRQKLTQVLAADTLPTVPMASSSVATPISPNASSVIPPLPAATPVVVPVNQPAVNQPVVNQPMVLPAAIKPTPAPPVSPPARQPQIVSPIPPMLPAGRPTTDVKFGSIYTEMQFRRVLQGLGYDINPQRLLSDSSAVVALQHFQERYGLALTGAADQPTQMMARKILRVLQYNLRLALDRPLTLTEYYDAPTEAAVREFQQGMGLRVNGIATVSVRRSIDDRAKTKLP